MAPKKSPNPIDVHVGGRVRGRRMMLQMNQTDLGARVGGITFQQIQKYEKGTNRIGASRLQMIAEVLGVPVAFFFEGQTGDGSVAAPADRPESVVEFLGTSDGIELSKAFVQISDPRVRRRIIELVKSLVCADAVSEAA